MCLEQASGPATLQFSRTGPMGQLKPIEEYERSVFIVVRVIQRKSGHQKSSSDTSG